ncbi:MAG: SUMF1/EgtB/PvdO family nonheme iron enzyme [Planctomycetota bacterium]
MSLPQRHRPRTPAVPAAALALALAACDRTPPPPPPPQLTAAAEQRLAQFADPSTWTDRDPAHPGARLVDPRTGIAFARIPKGDFAMGTDDGDPQTRPRHAVTLTRDCLLATTELTVGQWRRAVAEFAIDPTVPLPTDAADALPMPLSCEDAEAFARRFGYRLPTEAEWERAATCGLEPAAEPWRDEAGMREFAWFHRNSDLHAHAVATRRANAWGLCDMLGNLWEWTAEDFNPVAYLALKPPIVDPFQPAKGRHRVLRGGSFYSVPPATPRTRTSAEINERSAFFGARFARDAGPAR